MTFLKNTDLVNSIGRNNSAIEPCYKHLSLAQKMSASQLRQFGFELKSIRGDVFASIAIFSTESLSVTVNYLGEIGCMAALYFRK